MNQLNKLTAVQIIAAKPKEKQYSLADGGGLVLLIQPSGARWWRFRYRFGGRAMMLSMGTYPDTDLATARFKRDEARKLLAAEPPVNPSMVRQARKAAQADSFQVVADEWFLARQTKNASVTRERNRFILDRLIDRLGIQPVSNISTPGLRSALLSVQKKHGIETARRALGIASKVFGFAIADGKAESDPTAGLRDSLKDKNTTHRAAITKPTQLGALMRAIYGFKGQATTAAALKLLALNFTRPSELRLGRWDEIQFDSKLWVIPAERMKMRRKNPNEHLLPLAVQSIAILKELQALTGDSDWVFPTNKPNTPLSENAFNNALRKMGFSGDVHTAHGFRSTASTLLHEMNFPAETIETQLAHARGSVHGIYNRSHLLQQRQKMMQAWADYLDQLRCGGKVVPIRTNSSIA